MVRAGTIRKIRRSKTYSYAELAIATGRCEATVRGWVKRGMRVLDGSIPHLIIGSDARDFLTAQLRPKKPKMALGEVCCFKCKQRHVPKGDLAELLPNGPNGWRLAALCPCGAMCSRIVAQGDLRGHAEKLGLQLGGVNQAYSITHSPT